MAESSTKLMADYRDLLESYARRALPKLPHAEEHALLSKSEKYRDVLATAAVGQGTTYNELIENLHEIVMDDINWSALASLGRIVVLQNIAPEDQEVGRSIIHLANTRLPKSKQFLKSRQLEFELLVSSSLYDEAAVYLKENPELKEVQSGYLETDLNNPFSGLGGARYSQWLEGFNKIFEQENSSPIELSGSATYPFDRLSCADDLQQITLGPLVSVIMTSYDPEPEAFLAAARSILRQTWRNLELIIVDDASPNRPDALLKMLAEEDDRVRLLLLGENGGTYCARNNGLKVAKGKFVTGQDSDDWSHPERIESQVKHMLENPQDAGVMTAAVRTDENLNRIMPGLNPTRKCEVSFLTTLELARQVGGYLKARKAADSEFRQRIEFYSQKKVTVISKILYVIRLMPNSLSRGDFSSGWSHQSRRAFWNATLYWHSKAKPSELTVIDESAPPIPIPPRFQVVKPPYEELDFVFAADWRKSDGWQRATLDEVKFISKAGLRVGIMQMESPNSSARTSTKPNLHVQKLINDGTITQVTSDQETSIKNLIIHDPSIMQFPTTQVSNLKVNRVIIAPFELQSNANGRSLNYLSDHCSKNAEHYFSTNVVWAFLEAESPSVREAKNGEVIILPDRWPLVLDLQIWNVGTGKGNRGGVPVIGRSCQNDELHWPSKEKIRQLWPDDESADVWIFGDARGALRNLGEKFYSKNWVSFRETEIRAVDYMRSIDFFVYYPSEESNERICREAFEASAAGRIVILPEAYREIHGDTALYLQPESVSKVVAHYWTNQDSYEKQSFLAKKATTSLFSNHALLESKFNNFMNL